MDGDAFVAAFAEAVAAGGGRALEVGGAVRDRWLGRSPKDTDLEVYGLDTASLEAVIARFGPVRKVGARLGVYLLRGVEIALPQGPGGGEDPFLAPSEAARRRDLTVNALLRDPLTGTLEDPFDGRADLAAGRLRHVDPTTFGDDPLRLLRLVRLHAELGFRIDPATAGLARQLTLDAVAWQRVGQELERWLVHAPQPERGLDALIYTGAERHFLTLRGLRGCPMPGGGDAWARTRAVLADVATRRIGDRDRDWPLMLAALLHATGRPAVTRNRRGRMEAPGQAQAAASRVVPFLYGVDRGRDLARSVTVLVREQEAVERLAAEGAGMSAYRRLARRVDTDLLLRLAAAIHTAWPGDDAGFPAGERAEALLAGEGLRGRSPEPILGGRDAADLGVPSGPAMGQWLERAFQAQMDGAFADREGGRAWLARALAEAGEA